MKFIARVLAALSIVFACSPDSSLAQDLEARQLSNVPVGMNFVGIEFGHSRGQILLDSAIPIEDFQSRIYSSAIVYVRAISFFGMSAIIDAIVPFVRGNWASVTRSRGGW